MLKPWNREICRMPDGGDAAGGGGDPSGPSAADQPDAPDAPEASVNDAAIADAEAAAAAEAGLDMAAGWGLNNTSQTAEDMGFSQADFGRDYGRGISSALSNGNIGSALSRAGSAIADFAVSNAGSLVGSGLGLAVGGPFGMRIGSAIGSVFDGKGPAEIGLGFVGGFAPGPAGLVGGQAAANLGRGMDLEAAASAQGYGPGPGATVSNALGQGNAETTDFTGGVNSGADFIPIPGQSYAAYTPPPPVSYPQPAWRGLLGRTPQPQPNYWQGNSLIIPPRGLLS